MKPMSLTFIALLALAGCTQSPAPQANPMAPAASNTTAAPEATPSLSDLPLVVVHKNESCGCCNGWIDHMRQAGFNVEARNEDDMGPIKTRAGIPAGKGSCHTAIVGGYFIEGHVPAEDIKRLLAEQPDAKGLVLPGMPAGSPGMEMPDGRSEPYTVELVARDGSTTPFARH
jgi:hypothetical protein